MKATSTKSDPQLDLVEIRNDHIEDRELKRKEVRQRILDRWSAMYPRERMLELRKITSTHADIIEMRVKLGNRLKIKKDGTPQKIPEDQKYKEYKSYEDLTEEELEILHQEEGEPESVDFYKGKQIEVSRFRGSLRSRDACLVEKIYEELIVAENELTFEMQTIASLFPLWSEFLEGVPGCGEISTLYMLSMIDIHKATNVSKIWSFAGLSPGLTRGMKFVKHKSPKKYKPENPNWEIIRLAPTGVIVRTDQMVRSDRKTEGFLCPYNQRLRMRLCGILAGSLMKKDNYYRVNFYDTYRHRIENEEEWREKKKGHKHKAAVRHMIKMFLIDVYRAWRALEGLPIRNLYAEEYLGKKHNDGK